MAQATMEEIVAAVTVLLKAALTCPVEQYWRPEVPGEVTVTVQPLEEDGEGGLHMGGDTSGGVTFERLSLEALIEGPWVPNVANAEAMGAVRETIKQTITTNANRDLEIAGKDSPADGRYDGTTFGYYARPGSDTPTSRVMRVRMSWRV